MEDISICKQVSQSRLKDLETHNPGDYAKAEITFTANTVTHTRNARVRRQMSNNSRHTPEAGLRSGSRVNRSRREDGVSRYHSQSDSSKRLNLIMLSKSTENILYLISNLRE